MTERDGIEKQISERLERSEGTGVRREEGGERREERGERRDRERRDRERDVSRGGLNLI